MILKTWLQFEGLYIVRNISFKELILTLTVEQANDGYLDLTKTIGKTIWSYAYQFLKGYISNNITLLLLKAVLVYQFLKGYISNYLSWNSFENQGSVSIP